MLSSSDRDFTRENAKSFHWFVHAETETSIFHTHLFRCVNFSLFMPPIFKLTIRLKLTHKNTFIQNTAVSVSACKYRWNLHFSL